MKDEHKTCWQCGYLHMGYCRYVKDGQDYVQIDPNKRPDWCKRTFTAGEVKDGQG